MNKLKLAIALVGLVGLTGCGREVTPTEHGDNFIAVETTAETTVETSETNDNLENNNNLENNIEDSVNDKVNTETESYEPEVVFNTYTEPEQTEGLGDEQSTLAERLTGTSAWLQYSGSEYATDFDNFSVTELNGEFECYYSDDYYSVRIDYSDSTGECVIFVNDANDMSIMLARYE